MAAIGMTPEQMHECRKGPGDGGYWLVVLVLGGAIIGALGI
jgi:hypothetical protein